MEVDIPVDRSFQSYQNPDNFKSWCSWAIRAAKNLENTVSRQLSELTT